MVAGERTTLDFAYAGDVIGVINPGLFAIGDTISLTGGFNFKPLPQFQPEIFARLHPKDVGKRKAFDKGVVQLTDEGAIQLLQSYEREGDLIFAAVGQLQFEVMQYRLKDEYGVDTVLTPLPYHCSAWIMGDIRRLKNLQAPSSFKTTGQAYGAIHEPMGKTVQHQAKPQTPTRRRSCLIIFFLYSRFKLLGYKVRDCLCGLHVLSFFPLDAWECYRLIAQVKFRPMKKSSISCLAENTRSMTYAPMAT